MGTRPLGQEDTMNNKQRQENIITNLHRYHVPGQVNTSLTRNVIYISTANSLKHELKKLELCYALKKEGIEYITEAERIKKGEAKRRIDIVNLVTGDEIEIETDKKVKKEGAITIYI